MRATAGVAPGPARATRRRAPWWARLSLAAGMVLTLASAALLVGGKVLLVRYTGHIATAPLLGSAAAGGRAIGGPLNLLLVGIDERPDPNPADGARADSIIIVHVPAAHDSAYLVSIPRDTRVQIPAFAPAGFAGTTGKVNAAFQYGSAGGGGRSGGFQLLALTLQQLTGLHFNGGAIVNFAGFRTVVDAVGGVDMCVDERTVSIHIGWNTVTGKEGVPYRLVGPGYTDPRPVPGMRPQVYEVGCQHFNGWQALDYARQRELIPDGDYGRQRHQQQFLKALALRVSQTGLTDPLRLDRVLCGVGSALTVDGNGVPLTDWLFTLKGVSPGAIFMIKTNGGHFNGEMIDGQSYELLDQTTLQLFPAIAADQVGDYILAHPEIATSG